MKLSQDLYDAGILRHQRTGPSDDWAFDEPGVRLSQVVAIAWARLRSRLHTAGRRSRVRRAAAQRPASSYLG